MTSGFRSTRQTRALFEALLERADGWHYGYDLSRATGLKSGTLYPLLMRFSERGWVTARWTPSEMGGRPPRHMYQLTAEGRAAAVAAGERAPAGGLRTA